MADPTTLDGIIERELDRLAVRRAEPGAFEALFWCLYQWRNQSEPERAATRKDGANCG